MSFSFTFPHKPLLHKRIEDQWFDRSPKETQSTLTALEAAEEAYAQRLSKITTPATPPIVLGRAQHQNSVLQQQQQQQHLAHATAEGRSNSPAQLSRNRRSRSSSDTDSQAHTHDPSDDGSTVVNPSARNRGQASHQRHHQQQHQDPAQAANRSRRSAGGDR